MFFSLCLPLPLSPSLRLPLPIPLPLPLTLSTPDGVCLGYALCAICVYAYYIYICIYLHSIYLHPHTQIIPRYVFNILSHSQGVVRFWSFMVLYRLQYSLRRTVTAQSPCSHRSPFFSCPPYPAPGDSMKAPRNLLEDLLPFTEANWGSFQPEYGLNLIEAYGSLGPRLARPRANVLPTRA